MTFATKWTAEHKAAIQAAINDHGMTAPQAHAAANAGSLPGIGVGLPAIPIPIGTVRAIATDARRDRKAETKARMAPAQVLEKTIGALVTALDRETEKLSRRAHRGKVDPDEIGRLAKAGRDVATLMKAVEVASPSPTGAKPASEQTDEERERDFIGRLAEAEKRATRGRAPASAQGTAENGGVAAGAARPDEDGNGGGDRSARSPRDGSEEGSNRGSEG